MSNSIMSRLDELFINFSERFLTAIFQQNLGVSGRTPPTGQSPPLRRSVNTHVNPMRFQSDVGGPMPQSSGSAQPHGELYLGSGSSQVTAHRAHASVEAPEPAQTLHTSRLDSVRLQASGDHPIFVREPEDKDEDDQESVVDVPVDKTFNCLVNYIYDQYPGSCPHSDPSVPPRCDFESYFATSDPQSVGFQRLRWYPRVQEMTSKT